MDYLCDVIVLSWNNKALIERFVESFLKNTNIPCRLIIIDNASSDGTKDYLVGLKDKSGVKFKIILNENNLGFVAGNNQALEISDAEYVCLVNNDVLFTPGWLDGMIGLMQRTPQIGLINPDSNTLGSKPPNPEKLLEFAFLQQTKYNGKFIEMPFCVGFCMLTRKEVINKAGKLSEEFYPMFFEDSDYSMKVKQAGYYIGVLKGVYVWHAEHASIDRLIHQKKEEIFIKSKNTFIKKWGKILRIAWIVNSEKELLANLGDAVALAHQGNYVWFFGVNFPEDREALFRKANLNEHSGVNFIRYRNTIGLLWKLITKKKKYDIVINGGLLCKKLVRRSKVLGGMVTPEIRKIKYSY